jgi:DNA ligase 1
MPDIPDGESVEMQGSGAQPYLLKNVGGVYSCTCPAWRNQSIAIEKRTCKHLRKYRGDEAEQERIGGTLSARPTQAKRDSAGQEPPLLLAQSFWTMFSILRVGG